MAPTARPTNERILEGALEAVARYGPRRLSMATIAEQAGVCRGTVYRHFETREQLLDSLGAHLVSNFAADLDRATARTTSPHDRVAAVLEHHRGFADRPRTRQLRELQPAFVLGFLQTVFKDLRALTEQAVAPAFDAVPHALALSAAEFADLATRVLVTNCVFASTRVERATNTLLQCWDLPASAEPEPTDAPRTRARTNSSSSAGTGASRSVPQRILDSAVEMLAQSNTARPSISEVAEAAGVSRGTVYRHFPDRDALLAALTDHLHTGYQRKFELAINAAAEPRDRVRAAIDFSTLYSTRPQIRNLHELQPEFIVDYVAGHLDDMVALHRHAIDPGLDLARPTARGAIDADAVAEVFTRAFLSLSFVFPDQAGVLGAALLACWDGVNAVPGPITGTAPRAHTGPVRPRPSVGPRAAVVA